MIASKLVQQLRDTAEVLRPLTLDVSPTSAVWNGTKYEVTGRARTADPTARVWFSVLAIIAGLLDAQESPLTPRQIEYLKRLLLGGMGSFSDVSFAQAGIDERLNEKRRLLFETFRELSSGRNL